MDNKTCSLCMALVLALSLNAAAKHNNGVEKIPFKLYRNHLVVATGRLGNLEKRNLLIDTGANPSVIDESLVHELGLKSLGRPPQGMTVVGGVAQTYYAVLPSLDLGPVHRNSLVVAVANLSLMQAMAGLRIDAIVGLDALAPSSFQIDYASGKIIFGAVHTPASAIPMRAGRFAVIESQVNGSPVTLAVDTGTSQLVLFRNVVPETIAFQRSTTSIQLSSVVGDVLAPEIHVANFKVGPYVLSGSTALLTTVSNCCEFQGIFGISALSFRRVTFDFQHELLGLELVDDNQWESEDRACSGASVGTCRPAGSPGGFNLQPRR